MMFSNCERRCDCLGLSVIVSFLVGVTSILLQITGVITVGVLNVIALLIVAVSYLAITLLTSAFVRPRQIRNEINALLAGIVGTIVLSTIILISNVIALPIIYAILAGALLTFATLMFLSIVCFIKRLSNTIEE